MKFRIKVLKEVMETAVEANNSVEASRKLVKLLDTDDKNIILMPVGFEDDTEIEVETVGFSLEDAINTFKPRFKNEHHSVDGFFTLKSPLRENHSLGFDELIKQCDDALSKH